MYCDRKEIVKENLYKGVIKVYHSPSSSHSNFVKFLEDIVKKLIIKRNCMKMGDFNIDFMIDLFYTRKLQSNVKFRYETIC